jgi:hypothetical protein
VEGVKGGVVVVKEWCVVWYDLVLYGMVCSGMMWYDVVWCCIVLKANTVLLSR